MRLIVLFMAPVLSVAAANAVAASPEALAGKKIRIALVGDSTVTDEKGWGPGFKKHLKPEAECINWAKSGRSSKSYVNEGWWTKALAEKSDYVLIQFGHNDMPGKGPERETDPGTTYLEFMGRYVDEARAAGAKPILVTSMTRRYFTPEGKIKSDLGPYVEAVKKLAAEKSVPLIDLHARSIAVLEQIGPAASEELALQPVAKPGETPKPDKTHLSPKGAELMGKMVAEDLKKIVPELARYIN